MAITTDWQFDLNGSITIGDTTSYTVLHNPGPKGLLGTGPKKQVLADRGYTQGSTSGNPRYAMRLITIPVQVTGASASAARSTAQTLLDAWAFTSDTEVFLDARLPGSTVTVQRYYGQAGTVEEIDAPYGAGVLRFLLQFEALDPLGYNATAETDNGNTGSFTITNQGNVASDRCTATINCNGGTPILTHTGDSRAVTWTTTVASGTRVVDFRAQTVKDGSGNNKLSEITLSAGFPRLNSGGNSFSISGATDVDFSFRSAWSV